VTDAQIGGVLVSDILRLSCPWDSVSATNTGIDDGPTDDRRARLCRIGASGVAGSVGASFRVGGLIVCHALIVASEVV
jgi:hypothetical protein